LHCKYTNRVDILKARVTLFEDSLDFNSADYLLDKVLHNEWVFDESIFSISDNYYIFVLRNPEATMLSMIKRHLQNNTIDTVDIQTRYYIARLRELRNYWNKLQGSKLAIDSDEMLYESEVTLKKISHFLKLGSQLIAEYKTFTKTGIAGSGDMSPNIGIGKLNLDKSIMSEEDNKLLDNIDLELINKEFRATYSVLFTEK